HARLPDRHNSSMVVGWLRMVPPRRGVFGRRARSEGGIPYERNHQPGAEPLTVGLLSDASDRQQALAGPAWSGLCNRGGRGGLEIGYEAGDTRAGSALRVVWTGQCGPQATWRR